MIFKIILLLLIIHNTALAADCDMSFIRKTKFYHNYHDKKASNTNRPITTEVFKKVYDIIDLYEDNIYPDSLKPFLNFSIKQNDTLYIINKSYEKVYELGSVVYTTSYIIDMRDDTLVMKCDIHRHKRRR